MKTVTFAAVAENAYGRKLQTPVKYSGEFLAYESIEEVRAGNDLLTDDEIVDFRNTQRKNNARQKSLQAALDAAGIVKPTLENDPQLRLKQMYTVLIASGKSEAEARTLASTTLGVDWSE